MIFALFGPTDEITAIFYLAAVVCFALAAIVAPAVAAGRFRRSTEEAPRASLLPVGSLFLVALGLGLWLWPTMWQTFAAAF